MGIAASDFGEIARATERVASGADRKISAPGRLRQQRGFFAATTSFWVPDVSTKDVFTNVNIYAIKVI
jgi:hypothetical protein